MTAATETRPDAPAQAAPDADDTARKAQLQAAIDAIEQRRTRPPTCKVPHPFIVIEGPEGSGKSWTIAELSASPHVGRVFWIELGAEGTHDQYGAVPGAKFSIVEHNGDWHDIMAAVRDIKQIAKLASELGEPPVVLAIETMTAEWEMLSGWADQRARSTDSARAKLAKDPDADINTSHTLWRASKRRHRKLMTELLTFPGIVVTTAQSSLKTPFENNKPVEGGKPVYKVEAEASLLRDAMVVVRMSNEAGNPPMITKCRSVHHGVRPGIDDPVRAPHFTLNWLLFDILKYDPRNSHVRDIKELSAGELTEDERPEEEIAEERQIEQNRARRQGNSSWGDGGGQRQQRRDETVRQAPAQRRPEQAGEPQRQRNDQRPLPERVEAGLIALTVTHETDQLALITGLLGKSTPIKSVADLTEPEQQKVLHELLNFVATEDKGAAVIAQIVHEVRHTAGVPK